MSENEQTRVNLAARRYAMMMMYAESRIEMDFAAALFNSAGHRKRAPHVIPRGQEWQPKVGVTIAPQLQIGPFRADFAIALTVTERVTGGSRVYTLSDLPMSFYAQVVVECDGHDFHEKTKEQAARDKSRDRYLMEQGWPVVRYTGSEIYADAMACAAQALAILDSSIQAQERATADVRALASAERNRRGV